jgi:hypothetical protein
MTPSPVLLGLLCLDHVPLELRRIVNTCRHETTLGDRSDILGSRPFVDELLSILDRLSLFGGHGPDLLRCIGFPYTGCQQGSWSHGRQTAYRTLPSSDAVSTKSAVGVYATSNTLRVSFMYGRQ